jgi:hypothetical protein
MEAYIRSPETSFDMISEHYIWLVATAQSKLEEQLRPMILKELSMEKAVDMLDDSSRVPPADCGPRSFWVENRKRFRHPIGPVDLLTLLAIAMATARLSTTACVTVQAILEQTSGRECSRHSRVIWMAAATIARACGSIRFMRRC